MHARKSTVTQTAMSLGSETQMVADMRQLSSLVGELTVMLVVQNAYLCALRNRRPLPDSMDVDHAIASVAKHVPDHVADGLWDAREALVDRFRTEALPTAVRPD